MRSLFLIGLILTLPAFALADPSIDIHWNSCTGSPNQNLTLADGPTPTIVVTGHGFTQSIRGIHVIVRVGHRDYYGLPDSWRYDPTGCSEGGFTASYASAACPAIVGTNPVTISEFKMDGAWGYARLAYVFDPRIPDPNTTYTLAQFTFDKSNAFRGLGAKPDSCGCADRSEALEISYASWFDGVSEIPLHRETEFVSWEDPTHSAYCSTDCIYPSPDHPDPCSLTQPTPVTQRSWGSIKAIYR